MDKLSINSEQPLVILSQRLGEVTDEERRLEAVGVAVRTSFIGDLAAIRDNARAAEVIILGAVEPFDRAAIESLPALKAVVRRGVGYDNVDIQAATEAGVIVANVPDASIEEVSDHALTMLLTLERRLPSLASAVRNGEWRTSPASVQSCRLEPRRFSSLTIGIVGFGRIGAALARKAEGIYGTVLVHDAIEPSADRLRGAESVALSELMARADHISLHVPGGPGGAALLDADDLAAVKPGTVLVNTSRGGVANEDAIVAALRSGYLAAVGLDVTVEEPVDETGQLFAPDLLDRLLVTPHSAAWSQSAAKALTTGSVDAALALLNGELPVSVVNPDVLASPTLRYSAGARSKVNPTNN